MRTLEASLLVFMSITGMLGYLKVHVMQTTGRYPVDREPLSAGKHFSIIHGSHQKAREEGRNPSVSFFFRETNSKEM